MTRMHDFVFLFGLFGLFGLWGLLGLFGSFGMLNLMSLDGVNVVSSSSCTCSSLYCDDVVLSSSS